MLPNTTPVNQEVRQASAMAMEMPITVEAKPMTRWTQRTAEGERKRKGVSGRERNKVCVFMCVCTCVSYVPLPILPMEEVIKANFSKLTISHHGDL